MTAPADRQPGWRTANRPLPPRSTERTAGTSVAMQPAPSAAPAAPLPMAETVWETNPSSIPALAEAAMGSGGPLPSRPARQSAPDPTAVVSASPVKASPPAAGKPRARPDAKPMRVVYGAGALAAVSAMTVGLVQPDFGSPPQDELGAAAQGDPLAGTDAALPGDSSRRVVRYVFLRPGERAPAGSRVISEAEAAARGITTRRRGHGTAPRPDGPARQRTNRTRPAEPRDAQPPRAAPAPKPRPEPPVRTHQSG